MTSKIFVMVSAVGSVVRKSFDVLFSLLLTVLFCPLLFIVWCGNELIRQLIIAPLLRISTGGTVKLVHEGADNVFMFRKFGNSRNILVLTIYKELIDPEKYKVNFMSRVINFETADGKKPFKKLVTTATTKFGYSCWRKAENFDIHEHVRVLDQSSQIIKQNDGGEIPVFTESYVLKLLGELTLDMDESKPQWEEVIIQNYVYDEEVDSKTEEGSHQLLTLRSPFKPRSARIFRCHHGYMDGASLLLITSKCMTDGDFPYSADPLAPVRMTKWERFSLIFRSVAFGVKTIMKTVLIAARANNRFVTRNFVGKCHHIWSPPVKLETIMDIKTFTQSPFPSVLAAITAGAIKKLDEHYPAVAKRRNSGCFKSGKESEEQIEKYAQPPERVLIGMIGAVGPYPDVSPRNRYTVVNFHAPIRSVTRLQRLEKMKKKIKKLAHGEEFLVNLWLFQLFGRFPDFVVQSMMKNAGSPVVVSNTPWAKSPVRLMGDEVEELGGWVPLLAFSGVGFLITRYCDTLRFCGVAEDACMSEEQLRFMVAEIQNEIELLSEECAAMKKSLSAESTALTIEEA